MLLIIVHIMSLAEIRCKYSDYFQQRKGKQNIFSKYSAFSLSYKFSCLRRQ